MKNHIRRVSLLLLLALGLQGCALQAVQPWQKGALAKPAMRMQGDGLEHRFNQHIYASRENASHAGGVGGGGCGCN